MEIFLDELRRFVTRIRSLRSILLHLALVASFGILIPQWRGVDFLDSLVLGAYASLGLIFAGPAAAQAFPEGFPPSMRQAMARILVSVLYGEAVALALLSVGIATIYLTHRGGFIPTPDWESLAKCAVFGLGSSTMLAALAALVAVRFSPRTAAICLRLVFFALLILFYYRGQSLVEVGLSGAAACAAMALLFILMLKRACR